jgi:hypothetical protein
MIDTYMANILQLLSLPLEVLGITLALIEIRFRKVADYLRGRILGAQDSVEQPIGFLNILKRTFGVHPDRVRELQIVVLIFLMSIGLLVSTLSMKENRVLLVFLLILVVVIPVLLYLLQPLLRAVVLFVSRFAKDREIGTLGLMIACVGLLAETYQFVDVIYLFQDIGRSEVKWATLWMLVWEVVLISISLLIVIGYFSLILGLYQYRIGYLKAEDAGSENHQ